MVRAAILAFVFCLQSAYAAWAQPQLPDTAVIMSRIEAPQVPDRGGLDSYSMRELMDLLGVRGVSVAVIQDFKIHWV